MGAVERRWHIMIKMQIVMDVDKITRESVYDTLSIQNSLDSFMVGKLGFAKGSGGFYLGNGEDTDFSNFGIAYSKLRRQSWFLDNVKTWLYFNSAHLDPNEYVVEDFKVHCSQHIMVA
jgi:hypothetical protein